MTTRWNQFCANLWTHDSLGIRLDLSQMPDLSPLKSRMKPLIEKAFVEMKALEEGAIANPDENRKVGHYWLRAPQLAPEVELQQAITSTLEKVKDFAADVHAGTIKPPTAEKFTRFLLLGIGGSALGPQWLYDATRNASTPMQAHFIDNTDPEGFERTLDEIGDELNQTLVLVTSKSGGTQETRNAMDEVTAAYEAQNLSFGAHAVAITGDGSRLFKHAQSIGMVGTFPIWDWVGGRTSLFSSVGLVPAALLGVDVDKLLQGAADMDEATRVADVENNPAMLLALSWFAATNGRGERAMALLPYKDRLGLYSRYIQQLVMESLGKELDLESRVVNQGIAVYGNKGSTDQHALVQQLREGPDDFFVTFIEVLEERTGPLRFLDDGVTSGDHLLGFLLGTRLALSENNHINLTMTLPDVSAHSLGMLVAWFERSVGFYASLLGINAYHQPGVEAGKVAAKGYIQLQQEMMKWLSDQAQAATVDEIASALDAQDKADAVFYIAEHLVGNGRLSHNSAPVESRTYHLK
ncbi:MAG: glucose-6-phosphate isomerase [Deltaproteobacteria bacterium]|nr:MAG: glucose-6-phosphate isomerase [Deltaproteobacteria bacterium]